MPSLLAIDPTPAIALLRGRGPGVRGRFGIGLAVASMTALGATLAAVDAR